MLLFVTLHKDTNTGVEGQKGEMGDKNSFGGGFLDYTSFPWSAVICLSQVSLHAYLPARSETHLTATWEKPSPVVTLGHIGPPPPPTTE